MAAPRHPRLIRADVHHDGVSAWSMAHLAPPQSLAGLIRGYCDYNERTGAPVSRRELPHGDGVFIVNLGAPIVIVGGDGQSITLQAGNAFVAGVHQRPALSCSSGAQSGVHVYMPLESLRRLLGIPLDELVDRVVPLDLLLGAAARPFRDRLVDARSIAARIAALDAALTARFVDRPPLPPLQAHALGLLRRRLDLDVADIAREVGWSSKHLAARCHDAIGIGPRSFRRVLRFQQFMRMVGRTARRDWAMLALDAGYCDQSHMIREFREFAGTTPGAFFETGGSQNIGLPIEA